MKSPPSLLTLTSLVCLLGACGGGRFVDGKSRRWPHPDPAAAASASVPPVRPHPPQRAGAGGIGSAATPPASAAASGANFHDVPQTLSDGA